MILSTRESRLTTYILLLGLIISGGGYWYYATTRSTAVIMDYDYARDHQFIHDLFIKNWYWLIEGDIDQAKFINDFLHDPESVKLEDSYGKSKIKVLYEGSEPVGFMEYYMRKFYLGFIHFVAIREEFRSKGYAKMLVAEALRDLQAQGAKQITLLTRVTNAPALKVYKGFGFKETHESDKLVYLAKDLN